MLKYTIKRLYKTGYALVLYISSPGHDDSSQYWGSSKWKWCGSERAKRWLTLELDQLENNDGLANFPADDAQNLRSMQ